MVDSLIYKHSKIKHKTTKVPKSATFFLASNHNDQSPDFQNHNDSGPDIQNYNDQGPDIQNHNDVGPDIQGFAVTHNIHFFLG